MYKITVSPNIVYIVTATVMQWEGQWAVYLEHRGGFLKSYVGSYTPFPSQAEAECQKDDLLKQSAYRFWETVLCTGDMGIHDWHPKIEALPD